MPVENELKYVLDGKAKKLFNIFKSLPGASVHNMVQGYMDKNTRIRRTTGNMPKVGEFKYNEFTYKVTINGKQIEIETQISDSDFDTLWIKVERTLTKTRIKVPHGNYIWEIDFFYDNNSNGDYYFVMAEVEMPEDQTEPTEVPDFITNHLLYKVPFDDNRFKSKNLTKATLAKALMEELRNVKH